MAIGQNSMISDTTVYAAIELSSRRRSVRRDYQTTAGNWTRAHRRHPKQGLTTGHGNRWTRERVTSLRSHHRIAVYKPVDDAIESWLNLSDAAKLLQVPPKTLGLAAASKRRILCQRALGSSVVPRSALQRHVLSPNGLDKTQNTSRDRISISKTCSSQPHRQMGVVMPCCIRFAILQPFRGRRPDLGTLSARAFQSKSGIEHCRSALLGD